MEKINEKKEKGSSSSIQVERAKRDKDYASKVIDNICSKINDY